MTLLLFIALVHAEEPASKPVLQDPAYRFCNEPGAQADLAKDYCELLEGTPERCPGLQATCDGAPTHVDMRDLIDEMRGCASGKPSDGFSKPPPPPELKTAGCRPPDTQVPQAGPASIALRWALAGFVAIGLLVLLRVLFFFVSRGTKPTMMPSRRSSTRPVDPPPLAEGAGDDLLAGARRALAAGHPDEAVTLARAAALRTLADRGRIDLHRSRTDREYLRTLRGDAALREPFRELVRAFEALHWGKFSISIEAAQRVLLAAERLLTAGAILLVARGIPEAAASRYDPYGDAALQALFQREGYDATWRLRGLKSLDATVDILVLDLSQIAPSADDRAVLRGWVDAGGLLIAGGDASAVFPELGTYWDVRAGAEPDVGPPLLLTLPGVPMPRWPGGPRAGYEGRPSVDVLPLGSGAVLAVPDARLLRNGALVAAENEAFWAMAPTAGAYLAAVELPIPAHLEMATRAGDDANNPWSSLKHAKMLPFVLHALAFTALLALWKGWPLAVPREATTKGRLSFREHVEALGAHYARLGESNYAAKAYFKLWLARLGTPGLIAAARRAGMSEKSAMSWASELRKTAESSSEPNDGRDLHRVEELWKVVRRP